MRKREIRREQHQTNSRWLVGLNALPGIGSIYRVSQKSRASSEWTLRVRIERGSEEIGNRKKLRAIRWTREATRDLLERVFNRTTSYDLRDSPDGRKRARAREISATFYKRVGGSRR